MHVCMRINIEFYADDEGAWGWCCTRIIVCAGVRVALNLMGGGRS